MSKRDAERAVRDIWAKKMLADRESGGPRQSMADFFYSYARSAPSPTPRVPPRRPPPPPPRAGPRRGVRKEIGRAVRVAGGRGGVRCELTGQEHPPGASWAGGGGGGGACLMGGVGVGMACKGGG